MVDQTPTPFLLRDRSPRTASTANRCSTRSPVTFAWESSSPSKRIYGKTASGGPLGLPNFFVPGNGDKGRCPLLPEHRVVAGGAHKEQQHDRQEGIGAAGEKGLAGHGFRFVGHRR